MSQTYSEKLLRAHVYSLLGHIAMTLGDSYAGKPLDRQRLKEAYKLIEPQMKIYDTVCGG